MPAKHVTIYTDGSCIGNPGPGGYGVVLLYGQHRRELSGGFRLTTNNRMELFAAIVGLSALKEACEVALFSDSEYLVKGVSEGWAKRWKANGWRREKNKLALNWDYWNILLELCDKHQVHLEWLRGHSGHPENERCDRLAVQAAQAADLLVDVGYEAPPVPVTLHTR